MEVTQHLSSDTFTLMVKRRLRDQHSLPGWEWKEERLWYEGHIYVPKPLHLQLIHNHHDHPMVGHFGHRKTIDLIRQSCHWPGLPGWSNNTSDPVQYVHVPRQTGTNRMIFSNNCQFPHDHGNPFQWILLSNSWHQTDIQQY